MNIREVIRLLVPPLLLGLYRRLSPQPTWKGIYKDFSEIGADGEGLDGNIWADIVERETREVAEESRKDAVIPGLVRGDNSLLPLLAAIVCNTKKDAVKILDFGGGAGVDYLHVKRALGQTDDIEFHIVESERICRRGRRIHLRDPNIHFHAAPPTQMSRFDIVHMDSVLQYIDDYPALLKTLCGYGPKYFLLVRLSAGTIPTYVTKQVNVPGVCMPYQFIDVIDLIDTMNECGYELAFKGVGDIAADQSNFPVEYRMGHTCNLLFIRKSTS